MNRNNRNRMVNKQKIIISYLELQERKQYKEEMFLIFICGKGLRNILLFILYFITLFKIYR